MKDVDNQKEIIKIIGDLEQMILELKVDTQTIFNLLIDEDFFDKEDVDDMRQRVRNMPKYKEMYESLGIKVEPVKEKPRHNFDKDFDNDFDDFDDFDENDEDDDMSYLEFLFRVFGILA